MDTHLGQFLFTLVARVPLFRAEVCDLALCETQGRLSGRERTPGMAWARKSEALNGLQHLSRGKRLPPVFSCCHVTYVWDTAGTRLQNSKTMVYTAVDETLN